MDITKKLPPQPVNWAEPQWKYAASGIRCRADWKQAWVYDTDAGLIIAYSQAHANDRAREVLEGEEVEEAPKQLEAQLWEAGQ